MKSIAIITCNGLRNYGNRLQNYALTEYLKSFGFCVYNFLEDSRALNLRWILYHIRRCEFKELKRYLCFRKFDKKRVKYAYTYGHPNKYQHHFDYFVCGSDQIWNPEFAGADFYFAKFAPPNKRIAYAASFGVSSINGPQRTSYTQNLSEMKYISVREKAGADIVADLTGREAKVVLDPTLLHDRTFWEKMEETPCYSVPDQYILTYFLGDVNQDTDHYIHQLAETYGLPVVRLERKHPNERWYSTNPGNFLWLISHSSLVCTDSFHGTVFSVLLEAPFLVFERDENMGSMSSRLDTLLSMLQLLDRRFAHQQGAAVFEKGYGHIPAILEKEREKSRSFLKEALDITEL